MKCCGTVSVTKEILSTGLCCQKWQQANEILPHLHPLQHRQSRVKKILAEMLTDIKWRQHRFETKWLKRTGESERLAPSLSSVKKTVLCGIMGPSLLSPAALWMIRSRFLAPTNVTIHSRTSRSQWLLILFSRAKSCYIFRLNILPTKTRTSWGRVQEIEYSHTNSCMES